MLPSTHAVVLSMALFGVGSLAVVARREVWAKLIGLQIMASAAALAFVGFDGLQASAASGVESLPAAEPVGQLFALFAIAVAAAELALGLGLGVAAARRRSLAASSAREESEP